MINILYICTPNSIHDIKWMSFFAEQKDKYKVYAVGEKQNVLNDNDKVELEKKNICLLPSVFSFSASSVLNTMMSVRTIRKYVKRYDIDFVHVLFATPYALWCNFIEIPYVITTRGSDILLVIPSLLDNSGIKSIYYRWIFKKFKVAFENANYITCTSLAQVVKIKELFLCENIQVVRTGVNYEDIQKINKPELIDNRLNNRSFVFSPRFMLPIYNISYQIDAIELIDNSLIKDYTFVFIRGRNFDENYLIKQKNRLSELSKEKGFDFFIIDYLNQDALWMYFKKASLVLMTPLSDGTPNSALEAMASNCPLIISDLDYDLNLFDNTCLKTPLDNPKVLSEMITLALMKKDTIMLSKANEMVSKFGNRFVEMEKMEKIYNSIVLND